jgi:hypothetical protein
MIHSSKGDDLHGRVQTLARLRRGRIGLSDRWDSSGRSDVLIPVNSLDFAQGAAERPRGRHATEQRKELASPEVEHGLLAGSSPEPAVPAYRRVRMHRKRP